MTAGTPTKRPRQRLHSPNAKGLALWAMHDSTPHEVQERVGDAWRLWGRFPCKAKAQVELLAQAKAHGFDRFRLRRVEPAMPRDDDEPLRRSGSA